MTTDRNSPAQTGNDIYERVTTQIIDAIEAGAGEYRMPWHHDGSAITTPVNVASRKAYRGVNVIALWAAAHAAGYPAGIWGTYRQWQESGAQVRKGERGHSVVFWKITDHHGDTDRQDLDDDRDVFCTAHVRSRLHSLQLRAGRRLYAGRDARAAGC